MSVAIICDWAAEFEVRVLALQSFQALHVKLSHYLLQVMW
jgi:hypothetical protein